RPSFQRYVFCSTAPPPDAYPLSLHDALPICAAGDHGDAIAEPSELVHALVAAHADDLVAAIERVLDHVLAELAGGADDADLPRVDRKSTRLNSSHVKISYAVFCLKK